MKPTVKVGLALGGGFARGAAHIGVLQALISNHIPIHVVAGTSAGSLVGAMYCAGLDPWLVERTAEGMNWRALVRLRLRRDGLLDADGLERFMLGNVGDLYFSHLKVPFVATATDLPTGKEVLLTSGRIATAVRASCAFPGIFLPVRVGEHVLVDGGLIHPVPAEVCRRFGADVVIAVELNRPGDRPAIPKNLLHIMLSSLALVQRPHVNQALHEADVVIQPDLSDFGVIELDRLSNMIKAGRDETIRMMPAIRAAIESLAPEPKVQPAAD